MTQTPSSGECCSCSQLNQEINHSLRTQKIEIPRRLSKIHVIVPKAYPVDLILSVYYQVQAFFNQEQLVAVSSLISLWEL